MFITAFKTTGLAICEIFILGLLGYLLLKRKMLSAEGLNSISKIVMDVTLPLFIFSQFVKQFSFAQYPNWWVLPFFSIVLTAMGFAVGNFFTCSLKSTDEKMQFLSLIGFQNSGYLPLPLVAALLPAEEASRMYIYIFLFLVGFNLLIWSIGVHMLAYHKGKKLELASFFSAPVVATLAGLLFVLFRWQGSIPGFILRPLKITGDCTLPLAIFVVGASLAQISFKKNLDMRSISLALLAKLIILPLVVLIILYYARLPHLIGLLLMIQASVPPATSLSVILSHYKKQDYIVNQSIFLGHIVGIVTIPVFLSLFYYLVKP